MPLRKTNSLKDYEVFVCMITDEVSTISKEEQSLIKKFYINLGLTISLKFFVGDFPRTQNGKISFGEIKKILLEK